MHFGGDSKQWPHYIQTFKHHLHSKIRFSDSGRMDHLLSVLDDETKRAVSPAVQNGRFYTSSLKLLKGVIC